MIEFDRMWRERTAKILEELRGMVRRELQGAVRGGKVRLDKGSGEIPLGSLPAHNIVSSKHGDVNTTDTPADGDVLTYRSSDSKWHAGRTAFLALTDTPSDYTDDAGKFVKVGATALEFAAVDWADITSVPATFPPEAHTHAVGDLSNVDLTGLADDNVLQYDLATTSWKPSPMTATIADPLPIGEVRAKDATGLKLFEDSGTNGVTILDSGDVVVGTSAFTAAFGAGMQVHGRSTHGMVFVDTDVGNAAIFAMGEGGSMKWHFEKGIGNYFGIVESGIAGRFYILPGGNVGVANAAPDALLTVGDVGGTSGEIQVQSNVGRMGVLEADDSGNFVHAGSITNHNFSLVRNDVVMQALKPSSIEFIDGFDVLTVRDSPTWTPTIQGSTSNPTVTYTTRQGSFWQFGNMVWLTFNIQINTISGGGGTFRLPLPKTGRTVSGIQQTGPGRHAVSSIIGSNSFQGIVAIGSGVSYAVYYPEQFATALTISDLANGDFIQGSIFYWCQ